MRVYIKRPTQFTISKDLHLLDSACVPKRVGNGFYIEFGLDKCGTKVQTTKTHIIYTNRIIGRKENLKHISRVKNIIIKLQCEYKRKDVLLSHSVIPNQDKFRAASQKKGKFQFKIRLFPNAKFDKEFKYPATRHLRQRLFVQVSVKNKRKQLAILAKNCFATPTKRATPLRHLLIKNR